MDRLLCLMLVFFGGGLGCLTRYFLDLGYTHPFTPANILSCFLIGICYALTRYRIFTNILYQSFITVGFLGGLSTFTPLTLFALAQTKDSSFLMTFPILVGCLLFFLAIATTSYNITAFYLVKIKKVQPLPSLAATVRAYRKSKAQKAQKEQDYEQQRQQLEKIRKLAQEEAQRAAAIAAKLAAEASYKEAYQQALEKHTKEIKYNQKTEPNQNEVAPEQNPKQTQSKGKGKNKKQK